MIKPRLPFRELKGIVCNACKGTGLVTDSDKQTFTCDLCHGHGWHEFTGAPWPAMELDGEKILAAFRATRTAREIEEFRKAVDLVIPTHPLYLRVRRQRNACFWLAVALTLWTLLSLFLISRLMERLL